MRKSDVVLAELDALDAVSPGGWWEPFQVRYQDDSPLHAAGFSLEAVIESLREVSHAGLCNRARVGGKFVYRINEEGRAAVARAKGEST